MKDEEPHEGHAALDRASPPDRETVNESPAASGAPGRIGRSTVVFALAVSAAAGLAVQLARLPDPSTVHSSWPDTTAYMQLRMEQARRSGRELSIRYRPVRLHRIPERLRRAVLVSEDAAFFRHPGIDVEELTNALIEAWREKSTPRGASTLTQQLARNLYLSPDRTFGRKIREALIAFRLESELSKRRILELYLNVIELGEGVFGVQAGALHYFDVPVSKLARRQAAMLAATIPSPRSDNPSTRTREFRWRTSLILRRAFGERPGTDDDTVDRPTPPPDTVDGLPAGDSVRIPAPAPVLPDSPPPLRSGSLGPKTFPDFVPVRSVRRKDFGCITDCQETR